jgi:hypothetical protein
MMFSPGTSDVRTRPPHAARRTPHTAHHTPHTARCTPHAARRTPHAARRTQNECERVRAPAQIAFFMVHSLGVEVRRELEEELVRRYHASLVASGVDAATYSFERCWHDYRFNMWRALLSLCAMAPSLLKQHRSASGIFADEAKLTEDEKRTKNTYVELNKRCVAALQDHKWLDLLIEEGPQGCGLCSGISVCY